MGKGDRISPADTELYKAKESGRNVFVMSIRFILTR